MLIKLQMTNRFYREWTETGDLASFVVTEKETDLLILADKPLDKEARDSVLRYRKDIEGYIDGHPEFKTSLNPIREDRNAVPIVRTMLEASAASGVGPMAGVAGAIAEYVGRDLLKLSQEVIVENGGDIFLRTGKERILGIFAGESKFTKKIGIRIKPSEGGLGICTSSGTVGHSLSFGLTDATVIISRDTVLADCIATRVGNIIKEASDLQKGIDFAKSIKGILGIVIIIGDKLASWGEIELVAI